MSGIDLLIAIVLGLLGLVLIVTMARIYLRAIFGDTRGWAENYRFRQRERNLKSADQALQSIVTAAGLRLLRESFFLDQVRGDIGLVEKVNAHHMALLERLLRIADEQSKHLPNLAIVEDLIQTRCELMRGYQEAVTGRESMLKNRKRAVPAWALEEYRKKLDQIADQLRTNRKTLEGQLNELFVVLQREKATLQITYH